jgi:hypothetical protein
MTNKTKVKTVKPFPDLSERYALLSYINSIDWDNMEVWLSQIPSEQLLTDFITGIYLEKRKRSLASTNAAITRRREAAEESRGSWGWEDPASSIALNKWKDKDVRLIQYLQPFKGYAYNRAFWKLQARYGMYPPK